MFNSLNDTKKQIYSNNSLKSNINSFSISNLNNNKLDQSTASFKTKNSAENEYDEISNLIKKQIDHDNSVISKNSKQHTLNAESSVISCLDNWIGNVSLEDSRQFEENFSQIKRCKNGIQNKSKFDNFPNNNKNRQGLKSTSILKDNKKIDMTDMTNEDNLGENPKISNFNFTQSQSEVNRNLSLFKNVKKYDKSILLNNEISLEEENYTEEIDEEIDNINKQVIQYSNNNKSIKPSDCENTDNTDINSNTNSKIYDFPKKFNTTPNEEMNYIKPNLQKYDFYTHFSIPFNNYKDNINFDNTQTNEETEIECSDTIDPNSIGKHSMNNYKSFKSSFNGSMSINNQMTNKLNNLSLNNYTSNCSTNLTNRSNISNNIVTLNTPKHQKIISDHSIITKPSLNNPLSGPCNQHNYSLMQSQTPSNNYTKNSKNLTPTSIYKSGENKYDFFSTNLIGKNLQSSISHPSSTTNKNSSICSGLSGTHFNNSNTFNKKNLMLGNYSSTFVCTQNSNNSNLLLNSNMNYLFPYSQNTAPTNSINVVNELKNIVVENIISGKDKRTTIMLRNIPLKYNITNLSDELNQSFAGKFDFINMPLNLETKLNLGYAFVNFTDPFHIILFFETFQDRVWTKFKSDKKISINYADKQGKKDPTIKDDTMYFSCKDSKIASKLKSSSIEIPFKYCDLFKKILPHATIELPVSSLRGKGIPTFTVKKLF